MGPFDWDTKGDMYDFKLVVHEDDDIIKYMTTISEEPGWYKLWTYRTDKQVCIVYSRKKDIDNDMELSHST